MGEMTIALHVPGGETLLRALLLHGAELGHDCDGRLACASCRVVVRDGLARLSALSEDEEDFLERTGAHPNSRLSCQAVSRGGEFAIELPSPVSGPSRINLDAPTGAVSLSQAAGRHFALQLARSPHCTAIRISVKPAGCSGFGYQVQLSQGRQDTDAAFESCGISIVVDPQSLRHVQGARIDLVQKRFATRLEFDNPNAIGGCGCGKSFRTT